MKTAAREVTLVTCKIN